MNDYRRYEVEDLLQDETFQHWTTGADPKATAFWEQWLLENPDRLAVVRQAQSLMVSLQTYYADTLTDGQMDAELSRLVSRAAERRQTSVVDTPVTPLWGGRWVRVAAAALVVLVAGAGLLYRQQQAASGAIAVYQQRVHATAVALRERINTGDTPMTVLLSDGSVVTLGANSRLSYPATLAGTTRTVYLSGEAFFDVVKNPDKPFLVYANETVTKVLGTSFLVRAYASTPDVTVTVKTGRVSVYARQVYENAVQAGLTRIKGVVLTPNQEAVYVQQQERFDTEVVDKPARLLADLPNHEQTFEDRPVADVLTQLEGLYKVDLVFDKTVLARCPVTATFTDENLTERLDVICRAIGASYRVGDGQIVVTSSGCR